MIRFDLFMKNPFSPSTLYLSIFILSSICSAEEIQINEEKLVVSDFKSAVEITFHSEIGKFYQAQISTDLETWDNEGFSVKGTGGELTLVLSSRGNQSAFYRIGDDGDPTNVVPVFRVIPEPAEMKDERSLDTWHHNASDRFVHVFVTLSDGDEVQFLIGNSSDGSEGISLVNLSLSSDITGGKLAVSGLVPPAFYFGVFDAPGGTEILSWIEHTQ